MPSVPDRFELYTYRFPESNASFFNIVLYRYIQYVNQKSNHSHGNFCDLVPSLIHLGILLEYAENFELGCTVCHRKFGIEIN